MSILAVLSVGTSEGAALKPGAPAFIQNGEIRLGVDLGSGGGIFYFSERSPERNLLNHFDKGRFIQQSYYGVKDGSLWAGKPWRWNPVQGGGYKGQQAKVLESSVRPDSLYVKTQPKHWATGEDIPSATMEETIDLKGRIAHIHFKFSYTGDVDNPPSHQELPAVFMDYALPHLIFYSGSKPWSGGELTRVIPGFPNEKQLANENWAAYVDDADWGMGVYFPGTTEITSYRAKANLTTGPEGAACSYFAPVQTLAITRGWVHEYDIYLTIGKVPEIRERFQSIHNILAERKPAMSPAPAIRSDLNVTPTQR